jgi:hypothetical protein
MRIIAPPLTKMGEAGLDELKTIRADTARLNKQRANSMERWVAKYFGEYGNRVPMSGSAGAWKGDVLVELKNNPGKIVLECKLSAVFNNAKLCPQIRVEFKWLPKLDLDVEITNSKWGILVLHYHKTRDYYVMTKVEDIYRLINTYNIPQKEELLALTTESTLHDWRYKKNGEATSAHILLKTEAEEIMSMVGLYRGGRILTPHGEYMLMPLAQYRELIAEI